MLPFQIAIAQLLFFCAAYIFQMRMQPFQIAISSQIAQRGVLRKFFAMLLRSGTRTAGVSGPLDRDVRAEVGQRLAVGKQKYECLREAVRCCANLCIL